MWKDEWKSHTVPIWKKTQVKVNINGIFKCIFPFIVFIVTFIFIPFLAGACLEENYKACLGESLGSRIPSSSRGSSWLSINNEEAIVYLISILNKGNSILEK